MGAGWGRGQGWCITHSQPLTAFLPPSPVEVEFTFLHRDAMVVQKPCFISLSPPGVDANYVSLHSSCLSSMQSCISHTNVLKHICAHAHTHTDFTYLTRQYRSKKKDSSILLNNIYETKCIVLNIHGKRTSENISACLCASALFKSCKFEESMFSLRAICMPPSEIEIVWNK